MSGPEPSPGTPSPETPSPELPSPQTPSPQTPSTESVQGSGSRCRGACACCLLILVVGLIATVSALAAADGARRRAEADGARLDLIRLHEAQELFRDQVDRYGSLAELGDAGLVDAQLADGRKRGYVFELELLDGRYRVRARPEDDQHGDGRSWISETGAVAEITSAG